MPENPGGGEDSKLYTRGLLKNRSKKSIGGQQDNDKKGGGKSRKGVENQLVNWEKKSIP